MVVIGIDPSLSNTAIVVGTGPKDFKVFTAKSKPLGDSAPARVCRYDKLVSDVVKAITESFPEPCRIFLEGYSYNSKFGGEMLGEYGGILRWHLADLDPRLTEVAPGTLKKFVTGLGSTKKEQVMLSVFKNWGYEPRGNDDADAYGLFRLGLCVCGLDEPRNQAQRECVEKVK